MKYHSGMEMVSENIQILQYVFSARRLHLRVEIGSFVCVCAHVHAMKSKFLYSKSIGGMNEQGASGKALKPRTMSGRQSKWAPPRIVLLACDPWRLVFVKESIFMILFLRVVSATRFPLHSQLLLPLASTRRPCTFLPSFFLSVRLAILHFEIDLQIPYCQIHQSWHLV
mgnify:CR=1 FL=1